MGNTLTTCPRRAVPVTISPLPVPLDVACAILCRSLQRLDFKSRRVTDVERASMIQTQMESEGCRVMHACVSSREGDVTKPPIAMVILADVLIIAWRGSTTVMDWMQDASGDAVQCPLWSALWPDIWMHNGMMGHILHDVTQFISSLEEIIHQFNVRQVVFTGHSLGGGLATAAHLGALGQLEMAQSGRGALQVTPASAAQILRLSNIRPRLELKAVAFAAPMVFHAACDFGDLPREERNILDHLRDHSVNYVFSQDIVPRLPGHTDFCQAVMKECGPGLAKARFGKVLGSWVSQYAVGQWARLMNKNHKLQVLATLATMRQYRHCSRIVLMDSHMRPTQTLTNADILNMPFEKRNVRKCGRGTLADAIRSHHGQGLHRVIFIHKLQTRSIMRIKSMQHEEYLYAGADDLVADRGFLGSGKRMRRMALMWIDKPGGREFRDGTTSKRLWDFERVIGTDREGCPKEHFLIKSVEYKEYLYAASAHMVNDGSMRARMVLMLRQARGDPPVDLTDEARLWDFEPVEGTEFFRIKNVRYEEYLYAPSDDVLADKGLKWSFSKTKAQRRIAASSIGWALDLEDQSRWWNLEMVDDLEQGGEE